MFSLKIESDDIAVKRYIGRRILNNGEIYHIEFHPPPDNGLSEDSEQSAESSNDNAKSVEAHDKIETARAGLPRMESYWNCCEILKEINAEKPLDTVQKEIQELILSVYGSKRASAATKDACKQAELTNQAAEEAKEKAKVCYSVEKYKLLG